MGRVPLREIIPPELGKRSDLEQAIELVARLPLPGWERRRLLQRWAEEVGLDLPPGTLARVAPSVRPRR